MLAFLYLGFAIFAGERLCSRFFRFVSVAHRWSTGALIGLLLGTCLTYQAGVAFASASNPLLWGDFLFFAVTGVFLLACRPRRDAQLIRPAIGGSEKWDWVTLLLFFALACWMMFATLDLRDNQLLIGVTQWSDYGPNTAIVQSFAFGRNFPAEYPHFAGEPIRYHFLFYFQAGNLEFLGLNLAWSLNLLSILTLVCMLVQVMALGQLLFKSRAVGRLAAIFFFFHGNLNLVPFLRKQTSVKEALDAIYHLHDYLSSGYPYRGEDWGIWTQVVYINQRHLASAIGVFLVVLFFLLDRYLEWEKQRRLKREVAAGLSPVPAESVVPVVVEKVPASTDESWQVTTTESVDEARTFEERSPGDQEVPASVDAPWASEPFESFQAPQTELHEQEPISGPGGAYEGHNEPFSGAEAEEPAQTNHVLQTGEGTGPEPEKISQGEVERPQPTEGFDEFPPASNYPSPDEAPTQGTVAYEEPVYPAETTAGGDIYEQSTAPEFVERSFEERAAPPEDGETQESVPISTVEQEPPVPVFEEAIETPGPGASGGMVGRLIQDNLSLGKGFIFCGLLIGALPYWNSPVFTAAFAVLGCFFVLFPYRRYMLGLAIATAVVALPQLLNLRSGNVRAGPSLIHWGYILGNVPVMQVVRYLGFSFGLKWLLILVALLFGTWFHFRLFISICSLFVLTFCLQFSDEVLANHKFLNVWLVLANLFVAYGLWRLWTVRIRGVAILSRLAAIVIAAPIFAGGIIDFFPVHNASFIVTNYVNDPLIKWLQTETKPDAVFLSDKFVNHPILLAGRRIFFGYTYFTWSAGYNLPPREAAYKQMFESKNAHQVFTLLKAYGIDYVAFDSGIRGQFRNSNEEQVYVPNFKKVFSGNDYWALSIYKVPENADFLPKSNATGGNVPVPLVSVFEGGTGTENGQFNFPRGLAVDKAGNIFVADSNNGRLQKFSPNGEFARVIGRKGASPGEFREPGGIAVDSAGNIYVADVDNQRVQKLKPDGTFVAEWKGPDVGFYGPRDVCVGPDDSVYVVDQGHSRIVKFNSDGKLLAVWGSGGREDGQLADATSVAVDGKNDRVYVANPGNQRIEVFDTNGKFIAKWPVDEWRPSGWFFQDLAVDPESGRVFASGLATDEIVVFDVSGKKIAKLRPEAPDKLEGASSLALFKNQLYVLNTYGNRVSRIDLEKK